MICTEDMENRMKKHVVWKRIAVIVCAAVAVTVPAVLIFSGGDKPEDAEQADPQMILSGFYSALVSGKTEELRMYCDTTAVVMEYVNGFRESAESLLENEPGAVSVVSEMIKAEITGRHKAGDAVEFDFILSLDAGGRGSAMTKDRTAVMREEEGRWIIIGITGR